MSTAVTGVSIQEKPAKTFGAAAGPIALILTVVGWLATVYFVIMAGVSLFQENGVIPAVWLIVAAIVVGVITGAIQSMVNIVQPGEAIVLSFFGEYMGTVRRTGLVATLPYMSGERVSIKDGNFETPIAKVNDANGNPINISAIVVWRMKDTAKAMYAVENYDTYLKTQSEAAVRHVASLHPYDSGAPVAPGVDAEVVTNAVSLLNGADTVNQELYDEIAERAAASGVEIVEVRINNLAYSVEIAQSMLQRQQASAILDARKIIVEGASSIVEETVKAMEKHGTITDEEKSSLSSNLLLVLVGESKVTPTIDVSGKR